MTDTLDFVVTLLPPPNTDKLRFASTVHVLSGSATYSMSEISRREPGSSTQRSTYYLAGKAIATRINGTTNDDGLYFFHSDHLGSATVMSYGEGHAGQTEGTKVAGSETRYLPFGDWRTEPTANLTELGYTGHHHDNLQDNDLGLIYMNARFYVGGIGRFASADTIVPDPTNPQAYNRYSYVINNPLRYTDPDGHTFWDVVDTIFLGLSVAEMSANPTWANAGWLALDVIGTLPIIPSTGYLRYGDEAVALYNKVSNFVSSHGLQAGSKALDIIGVYGIKNMTRFFDIAHISGANKLLDNMHKMRGWAWPSRRGMVFQLNMTDLFSDFVIEIEKIVPNGAVDFVLSLEDKLVYADAKSYDWSRYNANELDVLAEDFVYQAQKYAEADEIWYIFDSTFGDVPEVIINALTEAGVIVKSGQ